MVGLLQGPPWQVHKRGGIDFDIANGIPLARGPFEGNYGRKNKVSWTGWQLIQLLGLEMLPKGVT